MYKKLIIIMVLSSNVFAAGPDIVERLRPYLVDLIGNEFTTMVLGKPRTNEDSSMKLPKIPKITKNTTSTEVFNNKFKETNTIDPEKKKSYDYNFVEEVILVTRKLQADNLEMSRWLNTLDQGGSREGVYRAMVLDSYYANMENYNESISKDAIDFSVDFFKKFLGKKINPNQFSTMNIYSVKRIMTEDALDILDIYLQANKYEEFLTWYAVFSSELGKNHKIWENKMRASSNAGKHKKWASSVPTEFVKSEVIIKIHKLLNNLQIRNQ